MSIVAAVGIAGGALVVSQVDLSRFKNATNIVTSSSVDLGRTVSRTQLRTALSNVANDMSYDINFNEVYKKGYKLGSVEETSIYQWTKVNVSIGPMRGIKLTIFGDAEAGLAIRPSGLASNKEIKQYLSTLSNYLSEQ